MGRVAGPMDVAFLVAVAFVALSPALVICGVLAPGWISHWTLLPWAHLASFFALTLVRALLLRVLPEGLLRFRLPPGRLVPCVGLLLAFGFLHWGSAQAGCQHALGGPRPLAEVILSPIVGAVVTPLLLILGYVFVVLVTGRPLGPNRPQVAPPQVSFATLEAYLNQVPGTQVLSSGDSPGGWWVKMKIDPKAPLAWHVVQELGHVLNMLSLQDRLPTTFKPVSPPPYANGGPDGFLSWVIECHDPAFDPDIATRWLEGRLPRPVSALDQWSQTQ